MPVVQYPTNLQEAFTGISVPAFMAARQQLQDAQANEALNQKKAQQDYDLQQQKTPYELEKLGLENQQIGLTNTGLGYTNRQQAVKAATDEALQQSNIQKGLSANRTSMDIDKVKQLGAMADHASKIADAIDSGVPLLSVADKLPPDIAQVLAQPGGTQRLRQWAAQVAAHSQEQLQTMQKVNAENASAERRTASTNASNQKVMQMQIDAGRFDKSSKYGVSLLDQFNKAKTPQHRMTLAGTALVNAQMQLQDATSEEERASLQKQIDAWEQQRQQAQRDYEVELYTRFKQGVDVGSAGNVPMNPTPKFNESKPAPKKDAQGRILLD